VCSVINVTKKNKCIILIAKVFTKEGKDLGGMSWGMSCIRQGLLGDCPQLIPSYNTTIIVLTIICLKMA